LFENLLSDNDTFRNQGVKIVLGVLLVWTLIIAFASFWTHDSTDFRKPLIVVGTMGAFLATWGFALSRSRKTTEKLDD
jgi:uncharacterized membrane protein